LNALSDNDIMLEVKAGNINEMPLLLERYHKKLSGFLYHTTGKADLREDLVQNVFYKMLKYKDTFTVSGEFKSWIYTVAKNVMLENVRKNKNFKNHYDVSDFQEKIDSTQSSDENILKEQELNQLNKALSKLSDDKRY